MFYESISDYQNETPSDEASEMQKFDYRDRKLREGEHYVFLHNVNFMRTMTMLTCVENVTDEYDNELVKVRDEHGQEFFINITKFDTLEVYELNVEIAD